MQGAADSDERETITKREKDMADESFVKNGVQEEPTQSENKYLQRSVILETQRKTRERDSENKMSLHALTYI